MTLPAKLLAGFSGVVVEHVGYSLFFIYAATLGLPAILLVVLWQRTVPLPGSPAAGRADHETGHCRSDA
jgi:hypothetical protein